MARIIVLGGGVCGLSAGMMLARDGHEITVLERDTAPVPESVEEAWAKWSRDGVTQFRMAHFLQPAGRAVLEEELPDVFAALVSAGALRLDMLGLAPPNLTEGSISSCTTPSPMPTLNASSPSFAAPTSSPSVSWICGGSGLPAASEAVTTCGPDTFFMAVSSCPRGLVDTPNAANSSGRGGRTATQSSTRTRTTSIPLACWSSLATRGTTKPRPHNSEES